jgi:hypothetical protein
MDNWFAVFAIALGYSHGMDYDTDQEKLCYFSHWTWASYDNGECRVITIYK